MGIPRKETFTSCLTKESKEPRDLVTITFSGTTTTSTRMTWSCLHITFVTCSVDAQGLSPIPPLPTTPTWWQTERGSITMSSLDTSVEDPSLATLLEVSS